MNSCLPVWEPFSLNANARFFTVLKRCHPERPRRSLRLRASRRIPRMFPSPCCFREFSPGFLLLLYSLRTAASNPRYGSKEDTQIQKLTGKNHHLFPIRVYPRKSAVSSFPITLAMTGPPGKPGYGLLGCDHARLRRSPAITAIPLHSNTFAGRLDRGASLTQPPETTDNVPPWLKATAQDSPASPCPTSTASP